MYITAKQLSADAGVQKEGKKVSVEVFAKNEATCYYPNTHAEEHRLLGNA